MEHKKNHRNGDHTPQKEHHQLKYVNLEEMGNTTQKCQIGGVILKGINRGKQLCFLKKRR